MWLADEQFVLPSNWTGVPNKVAGECVCVCVCGHVYVVYEDTNLYNDMGMT